MDVDAIYRGHFSFAGGPKHASFNPELVIVSEHSLQTDKDVLTGEGIRILENQVFKSKGRSFPAAKSGGNDVG
jgi:hypothetical protein